MGSRVNHARLAVRSQAQAQVLASQVLVSQVLALQVPLLADVVRLPPHLAPKMRRTLAIREAESKRRSLA